MTYFVPKYLTMAQKVNRNRQFSLVRELMQTRVVMMEGNALHAYRTQLLQNFNQHILSSDLSEDLIPTERHYMLCYQKEATVPSASPEGSKPSGILFFDECNNLVEETADGEMVSAHEPKENEERVLVLELCGPVTRSGGMCSYGSIDFRDMLLEYADDPSVKGFVLVTDTPGGTAFALHDFEQGMRAWDEAGKFSVQWIDGMSCSAGVALGSQCQQVVAYNDHDVIGCIGAMIAGWATADGTVDSDGNRFIDVTASQTPDKNGEFRAAAAGDYEALQKEVDACASEVLRILDEHRPQIPAEQRTGHTYEAKDVIGTLIDGIASFEDACHYALTGEATWLSSATSTEGEDPDIIEPEPKDPENEDPEPDRDPQGEPDASVTVRSESSDGPSTPQQTILTQKDMTLLERIAAALGIKSEAEVPAAEQTVETPATEQPAEEAASVVETPAEEPAVPADENEQPVAPAEEPAEEPGTPDETTVPAGSPAGEPTAIEQQLTAQVAQYDAQLSALQTQLQEQIDVNTALAESNTAALAAKDETIAQHVADLTALRDQLAAKEAELATANEQLAEQTTLLTECKSALEAKDTELATLNADLTAAKAEIAELNATAPACPAPAAPATTAEHVDETPEEFQEGMTAQEMIAVQKKKAASRRKKA